MNTEPALMSLTSVAKAIAEKRVSSREATQSCLDRIAQWQPRLNAFMAIEAEAALAAADAADGALAKGNKRGALHGVPLAHKDMYYEAGKVVTCGSKIRRDFVARTTSTALQRLKDAGTVRLGSLQMAEFAYGPTGHNSHYGPVHNPWAIDRITGGSSSGSGSAVAARLTFAALGSEYRRLDPDAREFLRCDRIENDLWPDQPCRRNAVVAVARHRRAARAHGRGLRVAAGAYGGRGPGRSHRGRRAGPGLHGSGAGADQRPQGRRAHGLLCRRARSGSGAYSRRTVAVLKREGADIVQVELPDQRQLTAGCQLVLAVEAAAFHKRWLIERPQDYGPQVLMRLQNGLAIPGVTYLEAMRWRGPALAAHLAAVAGVDAVIAPVAPVAAPTIAESDVGNSPDAESVIQRLTAVYPPDQLSRLAVAFDSGRFHPRAAFRSECS